jgi:ferredoxin
MGDEAEDEVDEDEAEDEKADAAPDDDADEGEAQEKEAEAEAMEKEVTEDEARDAAATRDSRVGCGACMLACLLACLLSSWCLFSIHRHLGPRFPQRSYRIKPTHNKKNAMLVTGWTEINVSLSQNLSLAIS